MNQNPMRSIKVEKVTLNVGAGKEQAQVDKGLKLLKNITGVKPVKTFAKKRIPGWGVRPGLPIGCKVTIRRDTPELISRLLSAVDNRLREGNFDSSGTVSFGIPEYIDIDQAQYDPEIGMMGLQVCITLERAGFRIKRRKFQRRKLSHRQAITKQEAIQFMQNKFNVKIKGEEE